MEIIFYILAGFIAYIFLYIASKYVNLKLGKDKYGDEKFPELYGFSIVVALLWPAGVPATILVGIFFILKTKIDKFLVKRVGGE